MTAYVEALRSLDSHERGILLKWALGQEFGLAQAVRASLADRIDRHIPDDAFVAMDYTLDWLYAATVLVGAEGGDAWPRLWPDNGDVLRSSPEDIDLLVAWEDTDGKHTLLVEAKGYTGWSNKQMASKARRLAAIFQGPRVEEFDVHFVLAGPARSKGLVTESWPDWMGRTGRVHFEVIDDPGPRRAVQRCDASGYPRQQDPTHWQLIKRRWARTLTHQA